jgi:hypothetical protein
MIMQHFLGPRARFASRVRASVAIAAALSALAVPAPAAADCADPFADPDDVLDLHIRLSAEDWNALRDSDLVGSGCDAQYPYFEVELRCGDEEPWIAVGARRKRGDQRGKDTDEKPPIKLDFNRVVAGQRWPEARGVLGYRKLSLNNGQEDNPGGILSALLTEHYAWRLMRAEVPRASGVAYARLYVHIDGGEPGYHGLYILIEDIDRTAIRGRFGGPDSGRLLKTTSGSCRDQVVFEDGAPNPAAEAFATWIDLDPGDFAGAWLARTEEAVELDELLRAEALRDVLANGADTVLGSNNSNFLSFDARDPARPRRHYLPWDLDDVFRPYPQDVSPTQPLESNCSAVGDLTRCDDEIRARYLTVACQLTNGTLHPDALLAGLDELDAMVRPLVAEEIEPVWSGVGADPLDAESEGTYAAEYLRMQEWIPARIASVREQITAAGIDCPEGCADGEAEPCRFFDCEGERRCEGGRWSTCQIEAAREDEDNGIDDDCDGLIDEAPGSGGDGDGDGEGEGNGEPGAGCGAGGGGGRLALLALALLVVPLPRRWL